MKRFLGRWEHPNSQNQAALRWLAQRKDKLMTHPPDHGLWSNEGEATREIEFIVLQWCHDRAMATSVGSKARTWPDPADVPTVRDLAERIVAKLQQRGSVLR